MKFCPNCGKEMDDDTVMCLNCCFVIPSPDVPTPKVVQEPMEEDKVSAGLVVLSAIIPVAGLVLAIIKWKETPKAAKTYLIASLAAWSASILLSIVSLTTL